MTSSTVSENPQTDNSNSEQSSLFVSPNGRWWPAGHGAHTPALENIMKEVGGIEGMIGVIYLIDSGEWVQEYRNGKMVPMTPEQRQIIEWIAEFPEHLGVKHAADKCLRYFDNAANEQARREQSEITLAAIRYLVNMENEGVR